MEKKSGIIAFAGLVTGIMGMGVALAGSIYYGALFEDVDTASRKNQRDIARIRDSIESISDRIADIGERGEVQLAHSGLKEKIRDRNEYRELERIKNELDQIRDTSPYTEEGEQAVLDILARQRMDVADKLFDRKKEKAEKNLEKYYRHFKIDEETSRKASELYNGLMEDWREYGSSWVSKEEDPAELKQRFYETNEQFKQEIIDLLGEDLAAKYIRTILPNRRFRKKLFGVK